MGTKVLLPPDISHEEFMDLKQKGVAGINHRFPSLLGQTPKDGGTFLCQLFKKGTIFFRKLSWLLP
jgi:hypothetical protein